MMELGSLKIYDVTKVTEEITYTNPGKTQVRSYEFTSDLGIISVVVFMADAPAGKIIDDDDEDEAAMLSRWPLDNIS